MLTHSGLIKYRTFFAARRGAGRDSMVALAADAI
jgi:hypothetical protein